LYRASSEFLSRYVESGRVVNLTKALILLVLLAGSTTCYSHGGVSIQDDVCIIKIGRYKAHFTGYLPQERATQEFCEDIPAVSESVFVLDFMNDELRSLDVDFRIIRDVNNLGVNATVSDLGGKEAIRQATVYYSDPKIHANGVFTTRYRFNNGGGYIGIVNATNPLSGKTHQAIFPFSVGQPDYVRYFVYYGLLFGFCGLAVFLSGRNRFFAFEK
jgi:hypothetical protein